MQKTNFINTERYKASFFFKLFKLFNLSYEIFKKKKYDSIIFDDSGSNNILPLLKKNRNFILSVRFNHIKVVYINFYILFFMLRNFFKRTLKQNYLISVIELINPKRVVTFIDNSSDFSLCSKYFVNKIKFYAIQNAHRTEFFKKKSLKNIFHQNYFCFGKSEKKILLRKKAIVQRFIPVGSLRHAFFFQYLKKRKLKLKKNLHDICVISELSSNYNVIYGENTEEAIARVLEYAIRYSKRKKLKLIIAGEGNVKRFLSPGQVDINDEIKFYKKYIKNFKHKISPRYVNRFSTYKAMHQSRIVLGTITTILHEALSENIKVLACDFSPRSSTAPRFPLKGLCQLKKDSYLEFEKKMNKILGMKKNIYFKKIKKNNDLIIEQGASKSTIKKIKNELN